MTVVHTPVNVMNLVLITEPQPESFTPPNGTSGNASPKLLIESMPLSIAAPVAVAVLVELVKARKVLARRRNCSTPRAVPPRSA
jgi:hypothetical protein